MTTITAFVDQRNLDKYIQGEHITAWESPGESGRTIIQLNFPIDELTGVCDHGKEGVELVFKKRGGLS